MTRKDFEVLTDARGAEWDVRTLPNGSLRAQKCGSGRWFVARDRAELLQKLGFNDRESRGWWVVFWLVVVIALGLWGLL
ncbi:MAG: hypothetical protein HOP28_12285 [Gemmatimonadales bacterium]|nr:hypothetical protein [Gemmatimonadales bacterium]